MTTSEQIQIDLGNGLAAMSSNRPNEYQVGPADKVPTHANARVTPIAAGFRAWYLDYSQPRSEWVKISTKYTTLESALRAAHKAWLDSLAD